MVMWLSGLHVPGSFLMALVQSACRKNGWSLDRTTLHTTVTSYMDIDDVEERPDQVNICILQLVLYMNSVTHQSL
jgi:dynein heavy chain